MKKLRSYQQALNKPTKKFVFSKNGRKIAQVYAPTGSGKTVCFTDLVHEAIRRGFRNIAIVHPRIVLSQDQLRRFKNDVGYGSMYTSFHSGSHYVGQELVLEKSTTDPEDLQTIVEQANAEGRPHITFSTYQSFHKLVDMPFDLLICDEAHYLVQERFYPLLAKIKAKKTVLYTATPITTEMEGSIGGMTDFAVYGDVIAQVEPKELIEKGYIVAPLIFQMECVTTKTADRVDVIDLVSRAFIDQHNQMKKYGMKAHHMLVSARDVASDIRKINKNIVKIWKMISDAPGKIGQPDIYTITAAEARVNNRLLTSRDEAIEQIKKSKKNVIVAHYDTLAEGIDIDTLSGVVLMRRMSKAKLLQTIGRCARPYTEDLHPKTFEPLKSLFNLARGIDKRKKPRCIVTLPVVDGQWIANTDIKEVAEAFIGGGYDDLRCYVFSQDDRPEGEENLFDPPTGEIKTMSAIENHAIEKQLTELRKFFYSKRKVA